jgi:hypothetical protein
MSLSLWPNATSERVFFAYEEQMPELLEIYDVMGRTMHSGAWIAEFDVTGLSSGIYFVRATSGEESVVKRMEVAR